jgi:transcriptional regulator with XRE-family HTH domain
MQTVGSELKARRLEAGLSQRQLSKASGVAQRRISQAEGVRLRLSGGQARKMERVFEVK